MTDNTLYRSTTAIISCKNKDFFTLRKKYFFYPKICSIFAFPNLTMITTDINARLLFLNIKKRDVCCLF